MQAARVRSWLADAALPLWADVGLDDDCGGFVERLHWTGQPDFEAAKRIRVQARQIYVFSHAALLDLYPGAGQAATSGFDFLLRHAWPDGVSKGSVHVLARDGQVLDARRDTYDHAFLLFGLSHYYRATGRDEALRLVRQTGEAISSLLRHPGGVGFVVDTDNVGPLHQNPHMHLFEAMLAAFEATGDAFFLDQAHGLYDLFRTRMFDRSIRAVREFHDGGWHPIAGEQGRIVEPGHQCEWIWLLQWYARLTGQPLCEEAWQMHDFVEAHGRPGGALLCDEVWDDGSIRKSSTRSWPQTEDLKAQLALAEAAGKAVPDGAHLTVERLLDTFLDRPIRGGWTDWIDANGQPIVSMIPASTFYHLSLGLTEYLRAIESHRS